MPWVSTVNIQVYTNFQTLKRERSVQLVGLKVQVSQPRSSAIAERPRDASCLSVISFNIPTAQFFLLPVTTASYLLVHRILLNSVLLSPIVSGGVQPPPDKHPWGVCPGGVCCRSWVGWGHDPNRGSDRVRSTGSVSFQQKYPQSSVLRCPTAPKNVVMTKGLCPSGGGLTFVSGV